MFERNTETVPHVHSESFQAKVLCQFLDTTSIDLLSVMYHLYSSILTPNLDPPAAQKILISSKVTPLGAPGTMKTLLPDSARGLTEYIS